MRIINTLIFLFFIPFTVFAFNESSEWITLFNGVNLDGWQTSRHPSSFIVIDSTIRAKSTGGMVHLFYTGSTLESPKFKNFELDLVCKGETQSNSGIFFHTDTSLFFWTLLKNGYEVQLNNTDRDKRKTGSLYAVKDITRCPIDDTKWFTVNILVQKKHIIVKLNGYTVVDYIEPESPKRPWRYKGRLINPNGGTIAIQAHDPQSVWYFKVIKIKLLPD